MREGIEAAGQLGVLGLDPLRFLYCRDPFERQLMLEVAKVIHKYQDRRDRNMAVDIANQVGKLFKT